LIPGSIYLIYIKIYLVSIGYVDIAVVIEVRRGDEGARDLIEEALINCRLSGIYNEL